MRGRDAISALHRLVVGDVMPDLTLIFDVPVDVGLERARLRAGIRAGSGGVSGEDPTSAWTWRFITACARDFLTSRVSNPAGAW